MGQRLNELLDAELVDAVNVPEIRDESRNGQRTLDLPAKMDPRDFVDTLRGHFPHDTPFLVNHPTVHDPPHELEAWIRQTRDRGVTDLVLVGGESSDRTYAGPGPVAAARLARRTLGPEAALGGITIPTRRRAGARDEPARMVAKAKAGIDFFTSQVIYESDAMRALVTDYAAACEAAGAAPRPIFLSFAPITRPKDARFLQWLGVTIPKQTRARILDGGPGAARRSQKEATQILQEVLAHVADARLRVPIGLNVEHVMRYNVDPSARLLNALTDTIRRTPTPTVSQGGPA
jgi:hypothetical protein